jgi:hypothetical protein
MAETMMPGATLWYARTAFNRMPFDQLELMAGGKKIYGCSEG